MKNQHIHTSILFILVCALFYSCTFTHVRSDTSDIEVYYSNINSRGKFDIAKVYLMDGSSVFVENLIIKPDSTNWTEYYEEKEVSISTDHINEIVFTDHLKGTIGGFIGGFLGGVAISLGGLLLFYDDSGSEGGGGYALIAGAVLGTIVGTVFGAIKGDKQVYVINAISE